MRKKTIFLYCILCVTMWSFSFAAAERYEGVLKLSGVHLSKEFILDAIKRYISFSLPQKLQKKLSNNISLAEMTLFSFPQIVQIPLSGTANKYYTLLVKKELHPRLNPVQLWVSNNPEDIQTAGILLENCLKSSRPIKLLFYHRNKMKEPLFFELLVQNREAIPADIHMAVGHAGPGADEIYVGHVATKEFFKAQKNGWGEFIHIPPYSAKKLFVKNCSYNNIVTGIVALDLVQGNQLYVFFIASRPGREHEHILETIEKNKAEATRGGFFADPVRVINLNYQLGKSEKNVRIGDRPFIKDIRTNHGLKGNYGVNYKIFLNVENTTNLPQLLQMFFQPVGGVARGLFVVNDELKETGWVDPVKQKTGVLITEAEFAPNEKQVIQIETQPQAGSFYPVNLKFITK